ncbi:hypothetical protein NQD34_011662, partial [Periophthalmus magnuspinnatus]
MPAPVPSLHHHTLLLLWLFFPLCSCLDPRDPNVCSLWETFTTSVKESYSQPFDQVSEEACVSGQDRYRCVRHRVVYRTAYRQAVKTDYRRRYQCCPGYYESADKCVARCTKECVHGRCVAPERCQCEGGWRGPDCSNCDAQHWGPRCTRRCQCENGAECDPVTGRCGCSAGFTGVHCEEPCPPGTYGMSCLQRCRCGAGGSCNRMTGECVCHSGFSGVYCDKPCTGGRCPARCPCQNGGVCRGKGVCACPPGWTGSVCTERCPAGRYGPNCSAECVCHNRGRCHPESGQCQCTEGFTGPRCSEECPVGSFGQDCSGTCDCANGARCYNIDGGCLCEPGFRGPQCTQRMCGHGYYGMHCEKSCLCEDKNTLSCHPMKGECTCEPGWAGLHCNETCAVGFYGPACLEPCLCVNGGACDGATGRCICAPGFMGPHCETVCKSGTFGHNCSHECDCLHAVDCSPVDGTCYCKDGWRGPQCSAPCSEGTWGPGCNRTCACTNGAKCSSADGSCTCSSGWQGALSDQPCPTGHFGPGCLKRCDCLQADGCHGSTGECRCLSGWTGSRCNEPCADGLWGPGCNQSCVKHCPNSATCLRDSGTCVCRPGYWGPSCQTNPTSQTGSVMVPLPPSEKESWGAIVGIMVLVLLVVLLLALLLLYRHRQKQKHNATPTVSFSASRPARSEYAVPDIPHSYHQYYSNPSYHTLRENRATLPHLPNNHDRSIKVGNTNNVLFGSLKNSERQRRGLYGMDGSNTLSADWKPHHPCNHTAYGIDRSYSYSAGAGAGKYYHKELKESLAVSSSSVNSENPYATIKDLPGLPFCGSLDPSCGLPESSYMEMKSAVPRNHSYTELSRPPPTTPPPREPGYFSQDDPLSHYDLPVNSHIPGHYDLPPLRRPTS